MTEPKSPATKTPRAPESRRRGQARSPQPATLGPGLHGGVIELATDASYRIRLLTGDRVSATLAPGVQPALAAECLRTGRMVLLVASDRGPMIAGALQTSLAVERDADGVIAVDAREIRLRAEKALLIEAGPVTIRADESGALRMEGDRMVLDMAALVRVLSAKVELP
ncbi:MAG: hypothetical protein U0441_01115 [Polyangiaceae bacterium]